MLTFRKGVLSSLAVLALALAPVLRADSGFAGEWKGMSDSQMSFSMHLAEDQGVLSGTIDIPGQGITGAELELKVKAEGDGLEGRFSLPDGGETTFTGKRAEDGSVSGTYEQGHNSGTFTMKKADAE